MRCPGEGDEGYGGVVVDEHLPEVLSLNVKKLAAKICIINHLMSSKFSSSVDFHISEQQRGEKENSGKFSEAPASAATLAITPAQQLIYQDHDTATISWKTIISPRFKMRALILSTSPLYISEIYRIYSIISL